MWMKLTNCCQNFFVLINYAINQRHINVKLQASRSAICIDWQTVIHKVFQRFPSLVVAVAGARAASLVANALPRTVHCPFIYFISTMHFDIQKSTFELQFFLYGDLIKCWPLFSQRIIYVLQWWILRVLSAVDHWLLSCLWILCF